MMILRPVERTKWKTRREKGLGRCIGAAKAGSHEYVHHVDVRQFHFDLPHHDGRDDVPATDSSSLQRRPSIQSHRGRSSSFAEISLVAWSRGLHDSGIVQMSSNGTFAYAFE